MEEKKETKVFNMSMQLLNAIIAFAALVLFVICKICFNFGVASGIFYGIMSIFIYALSLGAAVWAYLRDKKITFELIFSLAVFVIAIVFM